MTLIEGFLWGLIGGAFAELLGWFKLRHQAPENVPEWIKAPYYWVCTAAMVVVGGVLVVAYLRSDVKLNPLTAINIGASAPLILGTFIGQAPAIPPGKID